MITDLLFTEVSALHEPISCCNVNNCLYSFVIVHDCPVTSFNRQLSLLVYIITLICACEARGRAIVLSVGCSVCLFVCRFVCLSAPNLDNRNRLVYGLYLLHMSWKSYQTNESVLQRAEKSTLFVFLKLPITIADLYLEVLLPAQVL